MSLRPVRVLVVSDSPEIRSRLSKLLYEIESADIYWQTELVGLASFVAWCEPHVVVISTAQSTRTHATYHALLPAIDHSPARVLVMSTPDAGQSVPAPHRSMLDAYLSPTPTLPELIHAVERLHVDLTPAGAEDLRLRFAQRTPYAA